MNDSDAESTVSMEDVSHPIIEALDIFLNEQFCIIRQMITDELSVDDDYPLILYKVMQNFWLHAAEMEKSVYEKLDVPLPAEIEDLITKDEEPECHGSLDIQGNVISLPPNIKDFHDKVFGKGKLYPCNRCGKCTKDNNCNCHLKENRDGTYMKGKNL